MTSPLRFSTLDEAFIRYRRVGDGATVHATLPALFVAMNNDEVRDFPALRPHQRHPWHAFLTQLAAIALHHAGRAEPFETVDDWRAALLALTPDDADGAAWCLVSPADRPALLQAPVPGGSLEGWDFDVTTPDRLDMLITAKNHDLKQSRMVNSNPDDWLFSLLSIQTQEGSNSGSYKGISRMNSGAGSRPGVGISSTRGIGYRWKRDANLLLDHREQIASDYDFKTDGGLALTWLVEWDGKASIAFNSLDPLYIEICRRIRLKKITTEIRLIAATTKTPSPRIVESPERKGRTGDLWTPIDSTEGKILTISKEGFHYKLVADLLYGTSYKKSIAQQLSVIDSAEKIHFLAQSIARGNSKTGGYHERIIPIPASIKKLLASPQKTSLAHISKQHVNDVGVMKMVLEDALNILFNSGKKKIDPASKIKAKKFATLFEGCEDQRFFSDLHGTL